jgi:nicotinate-nucleotide adenylyltransferase
VAGAVKLGVLGGTFDPIHDMHIWLGKWAYDTYGLDKVLFIPAGIPPFKPKSVVATPEQRYDMACLALSETCTGLPFEVSRLELDRAGTSYTIDTLHELKDIYGDDAEIYFITGSDITNEMRTWYKSDEIFELARIVSAERNNPVSSHDIRYRIANGLSIAKLVPNTVCLYIEEHNLYR